MDTILFDLDNTLYAPERQLFALIDVRINRYMHEVVGIPGPEVDALRRCYWERYGVTLQGLMRHYRVDPEDYLEYVHDVDVASRLTPDAALHQGLAALPLRRCVFTNGSRRHAERVLGALGVAHLFDEIFDIRVAAYQPKPQRAPYQAVLQSLGSAAAGCIMVEDSLENLQTAKELGMATVLVGTGPSSPHVDVQVGSAAQAAAVVSSWLTTPSAGS